MSVYDFDEEIEPTLRVLAFEGPTVEWLNFVGACRRGEPQGDYDVA